MDTSQSSAFPEHKDSSSHSDMLKTSNRTDFVAGSFEQSPSDFIKVSSQHRSIDIINEVEDSHIELESCKTGDESHCSSAACSVTPDAICTRIEDRPELSTLNEISVEVLVKPTHVCDDVEKDTDSCEDDTAFGKPAYARGAQQLTVLQKW